MENFLKAKLQQDFIDCNNIDKAILLGQLRKEDGTLKLFDFIDTLKGDIATIDPESWEILITEEKKIWNEAELRKEEIREHRNPRDASEQRDLQLTLLREDYRACKEVMRFIQNLGYRAGWLQ